MDEKKFLQRLEKIRNRRELATTDLVSVLDLSRDEVDLIFNLAAEVETLLKGEMKKVPLLKGKSQMSFFMESSTRTSVSFELAGKNLGADTVNINVEKSSMNKGETLLDTAITLDQMQPDIIVMRTGFSGAVHFFARSVKAAVINAGDGMNEHPTQALLDLYTMRKFVDRNLKKKKLVIVGDVLHSRVFGSLARLAKMFEMDITVSAPHTLIRPHLETWGVRHEPNIEKALAGAHIVYALRLQTERAAAAFVPTVREYSKTYIINAARMKLADKNAVVMHPGPVIRELDVHTNILETDISLIPEQVFSAYCIRFVLLWLFGNKRKDKQIAKRLFKA